MADSEVGNLTAAATLDGTEQLHLVKSGNSRKVSSQQVADLAKASPTFTGTTTVEDFSDGTTTVDGLYLVAGTTKAWIRFNGSGTVSITSSLNISSLTDNGTGSYTANLTSAMAAVNGLQMRSSNNFHVLDNASGTTSDMKVATYNSGNSLVDAGRIYASVTGDLA